ncbi:MAG: nodulation protein NfeD [Acidobacteria bacterium]|nr:nodulation protein NfeD [Acidobacteriota bacterium]MBI3262028.1 nodulation protein NfeD [Acidobacteriota bacterium]
MTRSVRRFACAVALLASWATRGAEDQPLVYSAEVDALIHPISARHMVEAIRRADADRAALVVFTLRTPGGLVDSAREINSAIIAARTPVAVWVGPSGARAASAGFLITLAADVAAMAPGTHIGAAHPVSGTGEAMNETMSKKAASDVAADARTLASNRGRNVKLAEEAVIESRSFTEREALDAMPPLIDLIAPTFDDLIKSLDGRTVKRFDGRSSVLQTKNARVVAIEMNWRERILSAIAHPNIAYLLLSLGTLGLTIELWSPGAILPGVVGGICLLLAFFAFQILPVNYAGLLLVLFGILLLVLEIKITSFGLLTVGGIVSLLFGSFMLIDSDAPELQVSLQVILPVVIALSAILIFLVRIAIASQRRHAVTGESGMIDQIGLALTTIGPGMTGRVQTHGEIWTATASEPIAEGEQVRVSAVDGLTLTVRRAEERL